MIRKGAALEDWRNRQIAGIKDPVARPKPSELNISDDELRDSIVSNQLRLIKERGSDLTIFSPRASFMAHHIGDFEVSSTWAAICNELCFRVCSPTFDRSIRTRRSSAPPSRYCSSLATTGCCTSRPSRSSPATS